MSKINNRLIFIDIDLDNEFDNIETKEGWSEEDYNDYEEAKAKKEKLNKEKIINFGKYQDIRTGFYADYFKYKYNTFIYSNLKLFHYNGIYWIKDNDNKSILNNFIDETMYDDMQDEIKKYNDYCEENTKNSKDLKELFELVSKVKINNLKLREYACREKIIKDIICKITNNDIIFDDIPNLFCFKNKIFDLDLNKEIEPKPEYYLTMTTTYDYIEKDYSIEVEELKEIIKNCMPDEDVRTLYLKVLSSTMYGESNQKFIVCSGKGSNGKGMLHSLLSSMLGDYYYNMNSGLLLEKKLKIGALPELANINNKRCVVTTEPDADAEINCSLIKTLTGDAQICARGLYKDDTKTNIKCTLIMECNDKPSLSEYNLAMKRRLIDILFKCRFYDNNMYEQETTGMTEKEIINNKIYKINTFYSTEAFRNKYRIPLFLILKDYIYQFVTNDKKQFTLPEEIIKRVDSYLLKSDNFLGWFNDNYKYDTNKKNEIKIQDIFTELKNSEFYKNLDKKKKRELTKTKLVEIINNKDYLKRFYNINKDNCAYLTNFIKIEETPVPNNNNSKPNNNDSKPNNNDSEDDCYDEEEYDRIEEQKRQKKIKQLNGLDDGIPVDFN
jgi:phage/plasmid-associated DNA primase